MSFPILIHCTKKAEIAAKHHRALVEAKSDPADIELAWIALQRCQSDLLNAASTAFANAADGDDIHVISGRMCGDDDAVGVFFGSGSAPTTRFLHEVLDTEEDSDDCENPSYFITTDATIDGYLNPGV